jgi:hypothetical protein
MTDQKRRSLPRAKGYAAALVAGLLLAAGLTALIGFEPLDFSGSNPSQAAPEQRNAVRKAAGDLGRLVDGLAQGMSRGDYYERPSDRQTRRLADAYRALRAGKLERAASIAGPLGFKVVRYLDRPTRRKLVLLVERSSRLRGWGLYAHSPRSGSKLIVEIAHPKADIKSEKVGVETFRLADAADLFMAGAHRYAAGDESSDVAHNRRTVFHAVHRAALASGVIVFQPHGFDAEARTSQFGEIVVSSGEVPTEIAGSLAEKLSAKGYDTCLYSPGHCEELGGTTNVEGQSTRTAGQRFIHLELALPLRERRAERKQIVAAVVQALR